MNCEQVEELLSAYLDATLASEELHAVATHLQSCTQCSNILEEYRQFDTLLARLPRVSPEPALERRIFSSQAYQDLLATLAPEMQDKTNRPTQPQRSVRSERDARPHLVVLSGGRASSAAPEYPATRPVPTVRRATRHTQRMIYILIAAVLLLTFGIGTFISWHFLRQGQTASNTSSITPPAALSQSGPLPAGTYFVFLHDGTLWSASTTTNPILDRLTPGTITVSANWVVRPALPGHSAGDLIAYIDLQQGLLHIIRSDGQNDFTVPQPLLQADVAPAAVWDTSTGQTILTSLAWSPDGSQLAFIADPHNTSSPELFIYTINNNTLQAVPLPAPGAVSLPTWSPDGSRIAFVLSEATTTQIIDYNIHNHSQVAIASYAASSSTDMVFTLAWSSLANTPEITWSLGSPSHIHALYVSTTTASQPQLLAQGDFAQALYRATGENGHSSWLLVTNQAPDATLQEVELNGTIHVLATSPTIGFVQWSPDGSYLDYLDSLYGDTGTLHVINLKTVQDVVVAPAVQADQPPAWSSDSQHLAYATTKTVFIVNLQTLKTQQLTALPEENVQLFWSLVTPSQLLIAGNRQGCYQIDTQQRALTRLIAMSLQGPVQWTQIP